MKKLIIILDPAHGSDVAGKRSPDGLHIEYKWSREICADLKVIFEALGYEVYYTNYLDNEIGLSERESVLRQLKLIRLRFYSLFTITQQETALNG